MTERIMIRRRVNLFLFYFRVNVQEKLKIYIAKFCPMIKGVKDVSILILYRHTSGYTLKSFHIGVGILKLLQHTVLYWTLISK